MRPRISEMRNSTMKIKNRIFAIPAAPAAIPPKPKTPAIIAMIKKITVHRNIIYSLGVNNSISPYQYKKIMPTKNFRNIYHYLNRVEISFSQIINNCLRHIYCLSNPVTFENFSTMKTILVMATAIPILDLYSCPGPRELQAEMVSAQLIKIDTAFHYATRSEQMLPWRNENNVDYITYAPMSNYFLF